MKKGISLVALVVTIIVLIILTGVIVLTAFNNGILDRSEEAIFKNDLRTFQQDLSMYIMKQKSEFNYSKINVIYTKETKETHYDNMKKYIDTLTKEYVYKTQIVDDNLVFIGTNEQEIKWAKELGIKTAIAYKEVIGEEGKWQTMIDTINGVEWLIIWGYNSEETTINNIVIPNVLIIDGQKVDVDAVATTTFQNKELTGNVTISNGLYFYNSVFENQDKITKFIIEDDVVIGNTSMFEGCTGVEEMVLYDADVDTIYECENLKKITIKEGAGEKISGSASSIEQLIVEDNAVLNMRFFGSPLTDISLGENVTIKVNGVFSNCQSLTSVSIPGSTNILANAMFRNSKNLSNVELGYGLKNIYVYMFTNCTGLTNLNIPSTVTNIDYNAFQGCSNLKITAGSEKVRDLVIESGFTGEVVVDININNKNN